ncbi:hypothetical protein [Celeribacter halophilus]|uniref:hypothetical protein n=1 Tax=Celeribacter halophilus TaxID=576117 RepID=UPI003A95C43E
MHRLGHHADGGRPAPSRCAARACPGRELAKQILDNLRAYAETPACRIGLVVGGGSVNAGAADAQGHHSRRHARPPHPDLLDRKAVRLDTTSSSCSTRPTRSLDLGFIHALRRIAPLLPRIARPCCSRPPCRNG